MERVHDTPGGERHRDAVSEGEKRNKSRKDEQVGLKQIPKLCDLCHPAKHSHQSCKNGWNRMV